MILLLAIALASPLELLERRAECTDAAAYRAVVERCAAVHAHGFVSRRPALAEDRALRGWTSDTLDILVIRADIDVRFLSRVLGRPADDDNPRWLRFPTSVATENGACALAINERGGGHAGTFRLERPPAGMERAPAFDSACPTPEALDTIVRACERVWYEEPYFVADAGQGPGDTFGNLRWTNHLGDVYQVLPYGLRIRFAKPGIDRATLAAILGDSRGDATRRMFLEPPPMTRVARRCQAEAVFRGGRLAQLEMWRGPGWAGPPTAPDPSLPALAAQMLRRVEAACAAGPTESTTGKRTWRGLPLDTGHPLRLIDLLKRFGAVQVTRDEDHHGEAYYGRYTFDVPTSPSTPRCTLGAHAFSLLGNVGWMYVEWPR